MCITRSRLEEGPGHYYESRYCGEGWPVIRVPYSKGVPEAPLSEGYRPDPQYAEEWLQLPFLDERHPSFKPGIHLLFSGWIEGTKKWENFQIFCENKWQQMHDFHRNRKPWRITKG